MTRSHPAAARAALLLLVLAAVLPHLRIPDTLHDDAFITYRYALNVATGEGLVFNPGERVLGTTTPAYALLLGAGGALVGPGAIPLVSRFLNLALFLGAGLLLYGEVTRRLGRPLLGLTAAALLLLAPRTLHASVAGMETPLFVFLLVAALVLLSRGLPRAGAGAAGLLPLVRPEGVLVAGLVGGWVLLPWLRTRVAGKLASRSSEGGRPERGLRGMHPDPTQGTGGTGGTGTAAPWRSLLLLVVPTVVGAAAAWAYYGSPVPHSVTAKQAGLYPVPLAGSTLSTLSLLGQTLVGVSTPGGGPGWLAWWPAALALGLVVTGGMWLARRDGLLLVLPLLTLLLLGLYATSRTVLFSHYMANLELPARLCAWGALAAAALWTARRLGLSGRTLDGRTTVVVAVAALPLLLAGLGSYPARSVVAGRLVPGDAFYGPTLTRQLVYEALAGRIGPALPPGTTAAMPEIGELGFRLPHVRILDTAGLVSPRAVTFHPVPPSERVSTAIGVIPPELIRQERPDLVVSLEVFGRRGLFEAPWFAEAYVPVVSMAGPWLPWDSAWLRVWSRRDFEPGLALSELP